MWYSVLCIHITKKVHVWYVVNQIQHFIGVAERVQPQNTRATPWLPHALPMSPQAGWCGFVIVCRTKKVHAWYVGNQIQCSTGIAGRVPSQNVRATLWLPHAPPLSPWAGWCVVLQGGPCFCQHLELITEVMETWGWVVELRGQVSMAVVCMCV